LKVALNLLYLLPGRVGGTETYAAGLLDGLARIDRETRFLVFLNREAAEWPLPDAPNVSRIICSVRAESRPRRYLFEQLWLPRLLAREKADLVHSLGYVGPVFPPCPAVVTIPDLNYRAFGERMPFARRWTLATFVPLSARRADRVLTISEFARGEITAAFGLPPETIVVTLLSARGGPAVRTAPDDRVARLERLGVRKPFLMAFSSESSNKNIPRLLEAFDRARIAGGLPHQLVLVGHSSEEMRARSRLRRDETVRITGYVAAEDVTALLAEAEFFVFPSLYEGFGLPVLEAMAAGVPVACSRRASLPEVAGDAALFFDPLSVDSIADSIAGLAGDDELRRSLRERGLRNVRRFSWEATASKTLEVYREVAAEASGKSLAARRRRRGNG
jgi:glycosyltransferase involved in cell wall biosynthesis